MHARQDPKLAETRAFFNHLWRYEGMFDPDCECTYADRVRRRQPGDETLGLSPHMDAGTVERWIDPGYQRVYRHRHTDICHAVGDKHAGQDYASVIYIGSAPDCPKNRAYLPRQQEAFLAGRSAPDFAAMDFEVDFTGRATTRDLTPLGLAQMGF